MAEFMVASFKQDKHAVNKLINQQHLLFNKPIRHELVLYNKLAVRVTFYDSVCSWMDDEHD